MQRCSHHIAEPTMPDTNTSSALGDLAVPSMDLLTLMATCQPVLDACVDGEVANFRALREVNTESSQVALKAQLHSYTVTLKGEGQDTKEGVAKLLCETKLQKLFLLLQMSDHFSCSLKLRAFVREMGTALHYITSLDINVQDTLGTFESSAVMSDDLSLVVSSCPSLRSLIFTGHMPHAVMIKLGEVCRSLRELNINAAAEGACEYLQSIMNLQPVLLPAVSSVTLRVKTTQQPRKSFFPDMSKSTSVHTLDVCGFSFREAAHWLHLPPMLTHLKCDTMQPGPLSPTGETHTLGNLLWVGFSGKSICLEALAQLLREASSLQDLECQGADGNAAVTNINFLCKPTTAADLAVLQEHRGKTLIQNAVYRISCFNIWEETGEAWDLNGPTCERPMPSFFSSLPRMTGVAKCKIDFGEPEEFSVMLEVFPDVQDLTLGAMHFMTDTLLLGVVACAGIRRLKLERCGDVGPEGIVALFERLPLLSHITCYMCRQMRDCHQEQYLQLMTERGLTGQTLEIMSGY